ncbi:rRNA maturation RNase YbeY [Patescibacteria group bacterium]|nr:rRNA maturation RNase YbeY [Patescibacteria group bacterium]MBU3999729.1 rRNA maturation RNase YbeY [Patescibacteria group bacterium]MBU4057114.1 rRNA maturation RNase YbeY [Patescibacteria group bacterium]MBU4369018.1 rRNA maturation RNase YbeY [Patescibacteria group bacterium]
MLLVKNLTRRKFDKRFLLKAEKRCLREIGIKNKTEISLVICGKKKIRNINRLYRKKDKITDVLSFGDQKPDFIAAPDGTLRLGEIFICYPVAEKQARQYGYSAKEEMARLLIHGILHLAGYDHEKSAREAKKMFKLQEKIIAKIFKK